MRESPSKKNSFVTDMVDSIHEILKQFNIRLDFGSNSLCLPSEGEGCISRELIPQNLSPQI